MRDRHKRTNNNKTGSRSEQLSFIAFGQSNRHDIAERHEELLWKKIPNGTDNIRQEETDSGNQQQLKLTYFFRKPKYPLLCNIDGLVFAARSERTFLKNLAMAPSILKKCMT